MSGEINPYASPQAESTAPALNFQARNSTNRPTTQFHPADSPGRVAIALIVVVMLIEAGVIVYRFLDAEMVNDIIDGRSVNQVEAETNNLMILFAERARLLLMILAAIPFWMWSYRSHRNLPALLAAPLSYSPGWTIGGWFIPFANLVIPFLVMQEIYRGSTPRAAARLTANRLGPSSVVVIFWWCFWIACGVVSTTGALIFNLQNFGAPDFQSLLLAVWLLIAASFLRLGAAVCIIQAMINIIRFQHERLAIVERINSQPIVAGAVAMP